MDIVFCHMNIKCFFIFHILKQTIIKVRSDILEENAFKLCFLCMFELESVLFIFINKIGTNTLLKLTFLIPYRTRNRDNMKIYKWNFLQQGVNNGTFCHLFPTALSGLTKYNLCNIFFPSYLSNDLCNRASFIIQKNKFFRIMFLG